MQYPGVDGMVFHPSVFGYGRLVCEAFDVCIDPYAPSDVFQADVYSCLYHLSAVAWHFIDDVCLLLPGRGVDTTLKVGGLNTCTKYFDHAHLLSVAI